MLFTGDALLIEACGRTDFQSGSAEDLYNSIHNKVFSLPDETLVYPGHDYEGRFITTVAQEKSRNPRLGGGKSKQEFIIHNHSNAATVGGIWGGRFIRPADRPAPPGRAPDRPGAPRALARGRGGRRGGPRLATRGPRGPVRRRR